MYEERISPGTLGWKTDFAPHIQRYRFASHYVRAKRVLDAGCGVGYGSAALLDAGAQHVVGIDLSTDALEAARRGEKRPSAEFVLDNCEDLSTVRGPFDVVVAFEVIEHLRHPTAFLRRAKELLSDQGVLICSTPNSMGSLDREPKRPENPYHLHEYRLTEFEGLLDQHFAEVHVFGQRWTGAFEASLKGMSALWYNPVVRFGRLLQRIRGRDTRCPFSWEFLRPTENDVVINDFDVEAAWTLVAVCCNPQKSIV